MANARMVPCSAYHGYGDPSSRRLTSTLTPNQNDPTSDTAVAVTSPPNPRRITELSLRFWTGAARLRIAYLVVIPSVSFRHS